MNAIEVRNLYFSYDGETDVIKDVSFHIESGSYVTILGQNGSGKSTIAKLLIGLLEKKSGQIIIDGMELSMDTLNQIRRRIGIVFQNPDNQFIGATVRDDIAFGLENHEVDPSKMNEIIEHFAKEVNMTSYLDSEPTKLSGGQKQRVAIAGILAMSPDILIFDEATSMLDPQGKDEINDLIQKLHEQRGLTIISITHDIEEAVKSDKVIILNQGSIALEGKPQDILVKEKELHALNLDVPFGYRFSKALQQANIKVGNYVDTERLVNELCHLVSKK